MNVPHAPEGIFEGGILFDGCDYRTADGIVDFVYASGRLGLVRSKSGLFRAEFLTKHHSPQFAYPVWDESEPRAICGSAEEAKSLVSAFVRSSNGPEA